MAPIPNKRKPKRRQMNARPNSTKVQIVSVKTRHQTNVLCQSIDLHRGYLSVKQAACVTPLEACWKSLVSIFVMKLVI